MSLSAQIEQLYAQQLEGWPIARDNYAALQDVRVRTMTIDEQKIQLQYNPKRIISSSAKVDPKSVSERPCFLCTQNRPAEQLGIPYRNDYLLLVNPYPVFCRHLTITSANHLPQRIKGNFHAMLLLARDLPEFTIIYNGPNCGASAPDHFHYQAAIRGVLPIESDFFGDNTLKKTTGTTEIHTSEKYLCKVICITGTETGSLLSIFDKIYLLLADSLPSADEPMMNILAWFEKSKWIIHIFPRKQHRPARYFETGDRQILLSPASIDMGGVLIIPREKDYQKITDDDVIEILDQVCVDNFFINMIIEKLKA